MGLWEIIKGEQPGIVKSILNYENCGQFGEFSTEYALSNNNLEGKLVLRHGKYGQFWGCSTYPKCRFTRPLK